MRGIRLASRRLSLTALSALAFFFATPSPLRADAAPPSDEPHAAVLAGVLSAWQSGDVDRVLAHFAPTASVSWASEWSHGTGPLHVRTWIQSHMNERGTLTGRLERADGPHSTWRLSRHLPTDIRLGLPPQDSIVDVELRDGLILALSQHADPASRERYSRAVQAIAAHHPAFSAAPPPVTATPPRTSAPSPTGWIAATAACVALALGSAFARRPQL